MDTRIWGLTNGLYKLTVNVADDPPETTQISVGDLSVVVTNAGEYVFLMEKGPAYDLAVFPPGSNVTISAVDDIVAMRGAALRGGFVETALPARSGDEGTWTPDGGNFQTDYAPGMGYARLWWLPWLCGSPDVTHIDANAGAVEFHANLVDYRREQPVFQWTASEGLAVASPNSQTTQVTADGAVAWARTSMTVTASFGYDRSLVSYLYVSYGTESEPSVSCALSVQNVHFINEGDRPERVYPVSVSLICPAETNGVVHISHEGSDGALFWLDAAATQPLTSLSGISLSSVSGASALLGYCWKAPLDNQGAVRILNDWCSNRTALGDVESWMQANANRNGRNACAIQHIDDSHCRYWYFKREKGYIYNSYSLTNSIEAITR